mgnify:CR=1 FL=1
MPWHQKASLAKYPATINEKLPSQFLGEEHISACLIRITIM